MHKKWASDLNPNTARNYVYYFLKYLEWIKSEGYWQRAEEMIEDAKKLIREEKYSHLDILLSYIKPLNTGVSHRKTDIWL